MIIHQNKTKQTNKLMLAIYDTEPKIYEKILTLILDKFDGKIVMEENALGDYYHDIKIGNQTVSMHLNDMAGITIMMLDKESDDSLLTKIQNHLENK